MILFLSGEGATDIGTNRLKHRSTETEFSPGPMAHVINQIVESIWEYSPIEASAFEFVPESRLNAKSRSLRGITLPGAKRGAGTAEFFKNAQALARIATDYAQPSGTPVGAVLFRDCDGTRSSASTRWREKWESMVEGFKADGFELGVPMIPKPKSEAWLLCVLRMSSGNTCLDFENLPGNDDSPNSPKKRLAAALEEEGLTHESFFERIEKKQLDATRIAMPSFSEFKGRMIEIARRMMSHSGTAA